MKSPVRAKTIQGTIKSFTRSVSCANPGTAEWYAVVQRGKRLIDEGSSAIDLYDQCKNIRKMYFLRFLNEVGVLDQIRDTQFERELKRAAS